MTDDHQKHLQKPRSREVRLTNERRCCVCVCYVVCVCVCLLGLVQPNPAQLQQNTTDPGKQGKRNCI